MIAKSSCTNVFDINVIDIATPCPATWDDMQGDERARFCSQCQLNVYNPEAMTRDEAEQLITETVRTALRAAVSSRRRHGPNARLSGRNSRTAVQVGPACVGHSHPDRVLVAGKYVRLGPRVAANRPTPRGNDEPADAASPLDQPAAYSAAWQAGANSHRWGDGRALSD